MVEAGPLEGPELYAANQAQIILFISQIKALVSGLQRSTHEDRYALRYPAASRVAGGRAPAD